MGTIPELRAEKESPLPAPEGRASVVQMVRVVAHPNCEIPLDLLINADAGMRRHSVAPVLLKALLVPTQRRRQHLVSSRLVRAHDLLQPESPLSSRSKAADAPMRSPPTRAETGVHLGMTHPPGFDAGLTRPAEKVVQSYKQLLDARIGNAIPDSLAFLAEGHDAFLAQPGKVLGESRLAYTYGIDEGSDGSFAVFDQLTQDHQASLVGQRVQNSRNFRGVPLKIGKIFRGVGQFVHLFGCLLICSNVARSYENYKHGIVVASRNVDLPPATSLREKVRMHGLTFISMRGTVRRPIALLALLSILGILVSLVQPSIARGFSKAEPAQAAFAQSHSVKGGKPCKRVVPGAVGTLCSVGALIGLEINTSAVAEPSHGKAGILPYADKRLEVQWLAAPQYRPPRIDA